MLSARKLSSILLRCSIIYTKRCAHQEVRVRFAPSPTGNLHLGGLRTALYNYLYAKQHNGKFLLRIEDTDQTRLVPGAAQSLIDDLLWANIEIDEGPGFGGHEGPYTQSERIHIYTSAMQKLLINGTAYRCFCTERRLDLLRKEALRARQVPRYDNKCRHLNAEQVAVLLQKKQPYCVRFKLTECREPLNDLIYGRVMHNVSAHEGDPVIMKSDEYPTYHFANVIDDHLMNITHVLRGVEWQISTTKHLLIYKAFGWQPPEYGHLPLLVNPDGSKLSKRQGDIGIQYFRKKGYFPEALVNYVTSAGGGFTREKYSKPQVYTNAELADQFDIEKVNSHPSRLNPDLLDDFNRLQLKKLLNNKEETAKLVQNVHKMIQKAYPTELNLDLDSKHIENVLNWAANRLIFLQDLTATPLSFLWIKPSGYKSIDVLTVQMGKLIQLLTNLEDYSKDSVYKTLKHFAESEKLKFSQLMKSLRSILSGLKDGPGVAEMMEVLGKDVILRRLRYSLENKTVLLKEENEIEETTDGSSPTTSQSPTNNQTVKVR